MSASNYSDEESGDIISSCTPEELLAVVAEAEKDLIPAKSRPKYNLAYDKFMKWKQEKQCTSFSENVLLAFFKEKSLIWKPSTLWSQYSMLKSMIHLNHQIRLDSYLKLITFLKRKS